MVKQTAAPAKPIIGIKALLGAVLVLVIVVGGIFYLNSSSSYKSGLPYFPNLGSNVPAALAALPSYQGVRAAGALSSAEMGYLGGVSQFSVNYSGSVHGKGSGVEGLLSLSSPLYVGYSKYASYEKFYMNATSVSAFGDAAATYVDNSNGTFVCTNFNSTAVSYGNVQGAFFGNRNVTCSSGSMLAWIDMAKIAHFDFSQLVQSGIELQYTDAYQSIYNGIPCTYLNGTLEQVNANGTAIGAGAFGICVSDTYYVPLSIAAYLSSSYGSFSMVLNETSIFNSTTQAEVTTLPGS